ncbi:hypothetical protein NW765_014581 [Fusarium oxysporum]|nr:hypothetical protein NW765_014581 [Fusarium oxysporum]
MLLEGARYSLQLGLLLPLSLITTAQPEPVLSSILQARDTDKPLPGGPIDTTYLPAQIGGIIGAYAVSLVLVAITLLALSKKRREHIAAGLDEVDFEVRKDIVSPDFPPTAVPTSLNIITDTEFVKPSFQDSHEGNPYIYPSPASSIGAPGTNPFVDPRVVAVDRLMAQSQLEDMYKHVLEHEDAKKRGVVYDVPLPPTAHHQPRPSASASVLSLEIFDILAIEEGEEQASNTQPFCFSRGEEPVKDLLISLSATITKEEADEGHEHLIASHDPSIG